MARAIQPFHTLVDGDVLYAVSTNEVDDPARRQHRAWRRRLGARVGRRPRGCFVLSVALQSPQDRERGGVVKAKLMFVVAVAVVLALPFANIIWGE